MESNSELFKSLKDYATSQPVISMKNFRKGLWISPSGETLDSDRHIHDIIKTPEKFNLTKDKIKNLYKKYDERIGQEGKAREDLIEHSLKHGWIRIRKYDRPDRWGITIFRMTDKVYESLRSWMLTFLKSNNIHKYDDLAIYQMNNDKMLRGEVEDFVNYKLMESLQTLMEKSLTRIKQMFESDKPIGIISAFRGNKSQEENTENSYELQSQIRNHNFGYIPLDGNYIENKGTVDEKTVYELAYLIGTSKKEDEKNMFNFLKNIAIQYDQEAFIFKGNDGIIKLYDQNGNKIMNFDKVHLDSKAEIMSTLRKGRMKGRSFFLESLKM